ncbi:hypothetical protein AGMMS50229_20380 [Campylobacterota bacterium]|nr:hypothetical protein AGMMS50229_20380 [Campylobacterota bacterium]
MRTMMIEVTEHRTFKDAVEYAKKHKLVAIQVGRSFVTTTESETDRIAEAGVEFAYLFIKDGKYLTVPIN